MDTTPLKKFAQFARRTLIEQVQSKLHLVLAEGSIERRESPQAISDLEKQIDASNEQTVIEQAAYLWFNRFCALRFMDVNGYNRMRVVSPVEGQFQPEMLAEAKGGFIDDGVVPAAALTQVRGLLDGSLPGRDPQGEAYRLLLVAVCNDYHRLMPYLFARIDDYAELLMPDDLLSDSSILSFTREAMTPAACQSVEVIGWLYQFYISEKKDEVFDGLKKNKKITPANIPAATQLFTPHWIVRYLVENSLGRLWLLNYPESQIIEQMDYYIKPQTPETDFLKIRSPEELKVCDPACGSGHMLTYAYDLLFAIYLDAGYDAAAIPELILTKNLYGVEIDERAAELAAFALSMKALKGDPATEGNNRRRFFRKPIEPNICRLEKVEFSEHELDEYIGFVGRDLFTVDLRETLGQFAEADNFGSLIRPKLEHVADVLATLEAKDVAGQLFLTQTHRKVLQVLRQAEYLSSRYQVVVANPPYMGGKGMNPWLRTWIKNNYKDSKADLFAAFIERGLELTPLLGYSAMITMQSWMFLSSFENLRTKLLDNNTITSMAHLGARAFDSIGGEVVSTTSFVLKNIHDPTYEGNYLRLVDGTSESEKQTALLTATQNSTCDYFFSISAIDFEKIPGNPIAYWLSKKVIDIFKDNIKLGDFSEARMGLATGNNAKYVRTWPEVSNNDIGYLMANRDSARKSNKRWFPYCKGGEFRKWYGNNEYLVDWFDDGIELQTKLHPSGSRVWAHNFNLETIFKDSITWSDITSGKLSVRYNSQGFLFDGSGTCAFFEDQKYKISSLGILNTPFINEISKVLNPTLHFQTGDFRNIPFSKKLLNDTFQSNVERLVTFGRQDWDSYETSWDFKDLPLLVEAHEAETLAQTYKNLRQYWQSTTTEMQRLEEENNRIFIEAYGLQDELTPEVPLKEITLTCNPHYRYGGKKTEAELEAQLQSDTIAAFISYAVGCMTGRYSIDKPGLILANQGDTVADYLKQIPEPRFTPDADNAIPMIDFDGDWFEDDISERFKQFLKITFGSEHFATNLKFIEDSLGKDIKKYFLKNFYTDHVKRYKKRPIYWLFSSPKGSFNVLIYLHRYQPDTASVVLNNYLREFRTKLTARKDALGQVEISANASKAEKTRALKTISQIDKVLVEINDYERDVLYPLATQQIAIDLDDGVKVNYPKFGKALKKVAGLS